MELYDDADAVGDRAAARAAAGRGANGARPSVSCWSTRPPAALFAAAAGPGCWPATRWPAPPGLAALLIAVYAVVGRIEFPVGAGYVVPTQLILVPMLLMLPPAVVPVGGRRRAGDRERVDWALGRVPPRRVLSARARRVARDRPRARAARWRDRPTSASASCLCWPPRSPPAASLDLASSLVRMRLAGVVPELQLQMHVIGAGLGGRRVPGAARLSCRRSPRGRTTSRSCSCCRSCFLLWLLARDRSQRIDQAHHRLKLVEHERARLQSAVRRLGDAFAAKLELEGLLEILLHGSIEALDAAAGRLELDGGPVAA